VEQSRERLRPIAPDVSALSSIAANSSRSSRRFLYLLCSSFLTPFLVWHSFSCVTNGKPLRWLHGEVKTPPMSLEARREIGMLLRDLQDGETLGLPHSRPMPIIGPRCHELRVNDRNKTWRVIYRLDPEVVVILDVFEKKTEKTPDAVIENCRRRLRLYETSRP